MTPPFTFVVRHRAAPQGSKDLQTNSRGSKYMTESSKAVKPFRTAVKRAALGPDGRPMAKFSGPVAVTLMFEFRRAKSNTDPYPTGQNIGDLDKLTRAVFDALTQAGVIEDDSDIIVIERASKIWGPMDLVTVTVREAVSAADAIADFAEQVGSPIEPWQRVFIDEIVQARKHVQNPFEAVDLSYPALIENQCCNTVDHKSCLMMGTDNCPCPDHCTA